MLPRVVLVRTDASEERIASIIKVTRICELRTINRSCEVRDLLCQIISEKETDKTGQRTALGRPKMMIERR
jgi:hypothetical protein